MKVRKDRPSDEQIKDAIRQGWTQMEIINKLGTHSQRINQIRGEMENRRVVKHQSQQDVFLFVNSIQMY